MLLGRRNDRPSPVPFGSFNLHDLAQWTRAEQSLDDARPGNSDKPFVVEYYYKAKWGYADEFIRLFKKNHYPVLKKEKDLGRILKVTASSPRYHTTEEGRWDYRVTIVWKNVGVTNDDFDAQPVLRQNPIWMILLTF